MQRILRHLHQTSATRAALTSRVTAKSMLSGVASLAQSRVSPASCCISSRVDFCHQVTICKVAPHGVRDFVFRGPQNSQLHSCQRQLHAPSVPNTHDSKLFPLQPLNLLSDRRSRTLVQAASMQAAHAAPVQQEGAKDSRAHKQAESTLDDILPQANSAVQPFLAVSAEQPDRARVDYSKGQRPLQVVDPEVEMISPADWDVVCDVRTPDEFEEDRLIGAINTPVLSNEQRAEVGTLYKQVGQHEAKRLGAALISQNISTILLNNFQTQGKQLRILVYCWRGGERSQSLAHVLSRVGWEVAIIKRGYMGYRNQVRRCMEVLGRFQYHVIGGATGSGKGKLLDCLTAQGAQVVDLEVAADHRGSILGDHPTRLQPPQKMFESKLLHQMRSFSVERPVFIESESSLVGRRQVPNAMWKGMQTAAQVSELEVPLHCRVAWLRKNYSYFEDEHKDTLMAKLDALTRTSGKKLVAKWRELAEQSRWDEFVAAMLQEHYDTVYTRAQLKYLTPATDQDSRDHAAGSSDATTPQPMDSQIPYSQHNRQVNGHVHSHNDSAQSASSSATGIGHGDGNVAQDSNSSNGDATVKAAGALSHLFGGPRQKLMQQMNSKEAESALRWHREPVLDMTDETYNALALKLLKQYDPAALT